MGDLDKTSFRWFKMKYPYKTLHINDDRRQILKTIYTNVII